MGHKQETYLQGVTFESIGLALQVRSSWLINCIFFYFVTCVGGEYAGCDALKKRLLPWLSNGFVASSGRLSADTSLSIIAESTEKERQLEILQDDYEKQLDVMESDLNKSKSLADDLSSE